MINKRLLIKFDEHGLGLEPNNLAAIDSLIAYLRAAMEISRLAVGYREATPAETIALRTRYLGAENVDQRTGAVRRGVEPSARPLEVRLDAFGGPALSRGRLSGPGGRVASEGAAAGDRRARRRSGQGSRRQGGRR